MQVLAKTCANGNAQDPIVLLTFREIVDTIEFERNAGETLTVMQMFKSRSARKRIVLVISCAAATVIVGNQIAS